MSDKVTHEVNVSALLDDQLRDEELRSTIDQMLARPELAQLWHEGRRLQQELGKARPEVVTLPEGGWEAIAAKARPGRARSFRLPRAVTPVLTAAATLALVAWLAVSTVTRNPAPQAGTPMAERTVELAADRGRMSETRFIELTTELLKADPKYHRKMLEVMQVVNRQAYGIEGDPEPSAELASRGPEGNGESPSRQNTQRSGNGTNPIEFNLW